MLRMSTLAHGAHSPTPTHLWSLTARTGRPISIDMGKHPRCTQCSMSLGWKVGLKANSSGILRRAVAVSHGMPRQAITRDGDFYLNTLPKSAGVATSGMP